MVQGLAGQMQGVCKGAGAPILELTLPKEEEDEEAQQENTNPNGVKVQPKQEVCIIFQAPVASVRYCPSIKLL